MVYTRIIRRASFLIILLLLMVGFDYNETGNVFFNYQKDTTTQSSHYVQAFLSGESKIFKGNGLYAYYYFIADPSGTERRAGVFHLDLRIPSGTTQKTYTLPSSDVKLFYIEKRKGKVIFQGDSDQMSGWITLGVENGSTVDTLDAVSIKYSITLPGIDTTSEVTLNNGYISSRAVEKSYREEHKTSDDDYYYESRDSATVSCYDDDPYEDDVYAEEEEDSGCAGNPDNSGIEDDQSSSSCEGDPEDEDEENAGCGEDDDYESDDAEDSGCDGGGDDLEASSNFTKKKAKHRWRKMVRFFTPFLILTAFIFFLRRRKRVI